MTVGRIQFTSDDHMIVARLRGEIDLSNALAITDEIVEACGSRRLIVDLSEVTYLDSTGVRMIFEIAGRCTVDGQQVALVVPERSPLNRVLEMTRVEDVVKIIADIDEVSTA